MNTAWILGPCSIESRVLYFEVGERLRDLLQGREWYYKASFDKANRSTILGQRGPGFTSGVAIFREFKQSFPQVMLTTDIHECHQAESLAPYIDCIQIPAFLCRQTDLLVECGKHFNKVNIKKGQWLSPENILGAAEKVRSANEHAKVWLCERGTQFGYDRLIVDFRTTELFSKVFDRVILDCTHSTQCMGGDGVMSGDRQLAEKYLLCSSIFGYSGVFAEVHPNPEVAISDSKCQIDLGHLPSLLRRFDGIVAGGHAAVLGDSSL